MEKQTSWATVRSKAKQIVDSGGATLLRHDKSVIAAEVHSTSGNEYHPIIYRQGPKSWAISNWECDCDWGQIRNPANPVIDRNTARYQGRACAHVLSALYQAQREEMFKTKQFEGSNNEST